MLAVAEFITDKILRETKKMLKPSLCSKVGGRENPKPRKEAHRATKLKEK